LFYAVGVVGGFFLNRNWPLPVGGGIFIDVLAIVLTLASIALSASSIGLFRRSHTSIVPVRPATALVATGPYRFTRNPMYVSLAVLTLALGLFMNTWWPMLLLVPVLLIVQQFVIVREEAYLKRRFGEEYVGYTRHVRRWL
jgi:protein-S-isoprenylcysteine O-methyltransferase Ste14